MFSVCIKSFMLHFNNILVSPPHAQSQHFTFSKIKIDSQKNLHITVVIRQSVRPPQTLALIYSDPDKKSAILGHAP